MPILQLTLKQTLYWTVISLLLYTGLYRFVFYGYIFSGKLLYGDRPDILLYWYFYHDTYYMPLFLATISLVTIVVMYKVLRRRSSIVAGLLGLGIAAALEYEFNWLFSTPAGWFNIFQYEFIYHFIYGLLLIGIAIFLLRSRKVRSWVGMYPKNTPHDLTY